jgi:hypothetical protein
MKYGVEIISGAMIYIPIFIEIDSTIQKLMGLINTQHGDCKAYFLFFLSK